MTSKRDFRKIYDQYEGYVRKTLYWLVGPQNANDLLQEVFVKIWNNLEKFRGDSNIKTWIYRLTLHTVYDYWRKNKKMEILEVEQTINPENQIAVRELIGRGIRRMPENLQSVFVLFYQQELTVQEVSDSLGIAEGTVKSRLHQAREMFKEYLAKNGVSYE